MATVLTTKVEREFLFQVTSIVLFTFDTSIRFEKDLVCECQSSFKAHEINEEDAITDNDTFNLIE